MASKPARSRGVRNPVRNAVLLGLITVASATLIWLGIADMRATGRSGSPLLMLGLFPALLCPIGLIYYASRIPAFRNLRLGRTSIARWTVPADEFRRFCENDGRTPDSGTQTNYYQPPQTIPADGVDVIFSDFEVLIGDGYFPLSVIGGRRVGSVRYLSSDPPAIEFGMCLTTSARTSSATIGKRRTTVTLRVPVATHAVSDACAVVQRFQAMIAHQ